MKQKTVAIDARLIGGTNTGDSSYWTGLLYGLTQVDPRMRLLFISNSNRPPEIPWNDAFEWICVPARSSRWWSTVVFPRTAKKLGAEVLHSQYSLSPLIKKGGVTTIHDVSFFIGPQWFKAKDRILLQKSIPSTVRRASAVITVSNTSASEIERFIPSARGKTHVTYNACAPWVKRVPREEATQRVQRDFGLSTPYMLTVGTRWPRKNMELAVDAADGLSDRFPHQLVITGKSGWGDKLLGSRGKAVGYVTEEQLCALYSAAELYLAPSRHEGFGIPVLEAFRCGCPVMCSVGGALPEVAGDAAVVEPSWLSQDWTRTLGDILSNSSKLEVLAQRGLKREQTFTWEETAQRTLDVYLGAMA